MRTGIRQLRQEIRANISKTFTCSYDSGNKQFIIRIFNASMDKDEYRDKLYVIENKLFPGQGALLMIFVYNVAETKKYFPQYSV